MKRQQHDINFEEDSEKKSESQMGFEPTTLRDLVGCSNHLSYWRLYGEQGPICGSRLEPHHAAIQPSNDINIPHFFEGVWGSNSKLASHIDFLLWVNGTDVLRLELEQDFA